MKSLALIALAAAGCTLTTSGSFADRAAEVEGIYRVDSHVLDQDACLPGGDAVFGDAFAVAKRVTVYATDLLEVTSCTSLADCRAKAAGTQATGAFTFEFALTTVTNDNLTGFAATTGFSGDGDVCTMPELDDLVATFDGDTLTIQKSIRVGADYRADGDGFCTTDAGRASAERATCSQMETLTASLLEPL